MRRSSGAVHTHAQEVIEMEAERGRERGDGKHLTMMTLIGSKMRPKWIYPHSSRHLWKTFSNTAFLLFVSVLCVAIYVSFSLSGSHLNDFQRKVRTSKFHISKRTFKCFSLFPFCSVISDSALTLSAHLQHSLADQRRPSARESSPRNKVQGSGNFRPFEWSACGQIKFLKLNLESAGERCDIARRETVFKSSLIRGKFHLMCFAYNFESIFSPFRSSWLPRRAS